jgi:hypothetical protein
MPAESEAQRAYLNMKFGHAWVKRHHFDNKGELPEHVQRAAKHYRDVATNNRPNPPSENGNLRGLR